MWFISGQAEILTMKSVMEDVGKFKKLIKNKLCSRLKTFSVPNLENTHWVGIPRRSRGQMVAKK